jgi:hypothetical protein
MTVLVRHEYVDVPENQRLACLKFILKKEIASWKGGLAEDENKEEGENVDEKENYNVKINEVEQRDKNENEESELSSTKKTFPRLKKLLSRRDKNQISENPENPAEILVSVKIEEVKEKKVEKEIVNSSPFPSHFSPFPAAQPGLSSITFRPFQAVIFADDEDLAVTVCDSVSQLLLQKGTFSAFIPLHFDLFTPHVDLFFFLIVCVSR